MARHCLFLVLLAMLVALCHGRIFTMISNQGMGNDIEDNPSDLNYKYTVSSKGATNDIPKYDVSRKASNAREQEEHRLEMLDRKVTRKPTVSALFERGRLMRYNGKMYWSFRRISDVDDIKMSHNVWAIRPLVEQTDEEETGVPLPVFQRGPYLKQGDQFYYLFRQVTAGEEVSDNLGFYVTIRKVDV